MRKWKIRIFLACVMIFGFTRLVRAGDPAPVTTVENVNGVVISTTTTVTTVNGVQTTEISVVSGVPIGSNTIPATSATIDPVTMTVNVGPGGASTATILAAINAASDLNSVGSNAYGDVATSIPDGHLGHENEDGSLDGFYSWPAGDMQHQFPIDTSKKAIRTWARKGETAIPLNCPDSTTPDFSDSADTFKECRTAKSSYRGNRVQWIGLCAVTLQRTKITNTCLLKCPDITTTFKGTYVCAKRQFLDDPCIKVLSSFTCQPIGISGHVYFDENNSCSTSIAWGGSGVTDQVGGKLSIGVEGTNYSGLVTGLGAVDPGVYLINTPAGTETRTLKLDQSTIPAGYACSSNPDCNSCTLTGVPNRSIGRNFFLTKSGAPDVSWWQAVGAGVYAGNSKGEIIAIQSKMPTGKKLIVPGSTGTVGAL